MLQDFRVNIIGRVLLLLLSVFVLVALIRGMNYYITPALLAGVIVFQVVSLIRYVEDTNREMIAFLSSIKYDDFSQSYLPSGKGGSFDQLNREFNRVIQRFRALRAEKEAEYQYLKNIIQHVGIGLLSFDREGNVQLFNATAKKLLKSPRLRNIEELQQDNPELYDTIRQLRTGSKALLSIRQGGEVIQLSVYAIELYLKGEDFKLITMQNIRSELEEKEMEAWQNLIRVLTHEIMNSVTPISSLSATLQGEIDYLREEGRQIQVDELEDIQMGIQTIRRRSEGMISFVQQFRSLTHLAAPNLSHVPVRELFEDLRMLMKNDLAAKGIQLVIKLDPENLIITADRQQIEQVIINLLKNASEAFQQEDQQGKSISLVGRQGKASGRPVISVCDNGMGIEQETLERIFIPFFTTKKSGSGIGLSLSRQIMRQHKGSITVRSTPGEGTEFSLRF